MPKDWCLICCTRHEIEGDCPGSLLATGPERHGWRVNVDTPHGVEAFGVLVAECGGLWRARILTYPKILWLVPGGKETVKFIGATPQEAESQAIGFILRHVEERGFVALGDVCEAVPGDFDPEALVDGLARPNGPPAARKIRFLFVRYGLEGLTDTGGTGNLSESGLFVITGEPVDTGQWLKMALDIDDQEPLDLRGCVRWMNTQHHAGRSPGMGIQIESPPPDYLDYVRALD